MSQPRRQTILVGIMILLLIGAAAWSVDWMMQQRQQAQDAAADLAECQMLVRRIEALREAPTVASAEAMGVQEFGEHIEAASRLANFDPSALRGVFPQAAQRVGDSPYLRKPTAITLRHVPLHDLVTFLYHISGDTGLMVRDLRLRTPHAEAPEDVWDAEVTLTYLIYEPAERL